MSDMLELRAIIGAETGGFESGIARIRSGINLTVGDLGRLGRAAARSVGMDDPMASAATFERALANIRAVSNMSEADIARLRTQILTLGRDAVDGPQALVDAYYDIASGVADSTKWMSVLDSAVATSEAGQADLGATTDGLIGIMNAYSASGLSADAASNILTRSVGLGKGTMDEFVAAIGPNVGLMGQMGVGFGEVGAAVAFLTQQGIPASMAMTALVGSVNALSTPNKAMAEIMARLGETSGTAMIQQYGLAGALARVRDEAGGLDEFNAALGRVEAQRAIALTEPAFLAGLGKFNEGLATATDTARAIQLDTPAAQLDKLRSAGEAMSIEMGEKLLPTAGNVIETLTDMGDTGVVVAGVLEGVKTLATELGGTVVIAGTSAALGAKAAGAAAGAGGGAGGGVSLGPVVKAALDAAPPLAVAATLIGEYGLSIKAVTAAFDLATGAMFDTPEEVAAFNAAIGKVADTLDETQSGIDEWMLLQTGAGGLAGLPDDILKNPALVWGWMTQFTTPGEELGMSQAMMAENAGLGAGANLGGFMSGLPASDELQIMVDDGLPPALSMQAFYNAGVSPANTLQMLADRGYIPATELTSLAAAGFPPTTRLDEIWRVGLLPSASLSRLLSLVLTAAGETPPGGEEAPGRDFGGAVVAGRGYRVGVPEVFFPSSSGTAVPLSDLAGGGGGPQTVQFTGPIYVQGVQDVPGLLRQLQAEARRKGRTLLS